MRKKMSKNILEASLEGAEHIVLLGHIHPDGDCIGTTLGLLNYLRGELSADRGRTVSRPSGC